MEKTNNETLLERYGDSSVDPSEVRFRKNLMEAAKSDPREEADLSDADEFEIIVAEFLNTSNLTSSEIKKTLDN